VCGCGRRGTKYNKKSLLPVTAFQLITGGALQKIGEFDNQAEASAAAGMPGQLKKMSSKSHLSPPASWEEAAHTIYGAI
jgi:hypothetical protein